MPRLRDNSVPTIFPKSENQNLSTTGNIGKTNVSSTSALVSSRSQSSHQIEETAWDKVVQNKIRRLKEKFIKQRQKIKCLNEKVRRRNIEIAKFQDIIRKDLKIRNRINMEQAALMEELAGGENVATKSASIFEDTSKTIEQPVASSSSALIVKSQSKSENKKDTKNVLLEQCDVQIDCQPSTSNTLATKVTGDIREDFIEEEFLEDYFEDDFVQPPANTGSAGEAPGSVEVAGSVEVEVCEGEFSWQRPAAVVPCDVDDAEWLGDDAVMFEPPSKPTAAVTEPALEPEPEPCHEGYRCNNCGGDIVGFRYVCVQCVDYDLCCTCEAAAAHAVHYVLRVPGPRPHSEVAAVLTTIRRALLADSILLVDGFQAEVKEEPDQPDPISLEAAVEDQDGDDITLQDGDDITSQDGDDIASQDGDDITSQDGDEGSVASEDSYHPSGDNNSDTDEQVTAHSSASRYVSRTSSRTTTHTPKISLVPQNSLMTTTSRIIKTTPSPKTVPMIKISSPKTTAMTESTPMSKPICYLDLTNNTIVVLGNKKPNISPETLRSHMSAQLRNLPQCTDKSRVAERNLPQSTEKSRVAERNLPQSTEKSRVAERNLPQCTDKSKTAEKRPMPVPVQVNKSVIQAVLSAKRGT